jgi:RNA polymerase sigma-70 factor, ECF subfamily
MNGPSDAELIERILAGEQELYAVIVGRYQHMLQRFAVGMIQDPDTAADLVQDSFVKAYVSLSDCRDRQHFSAWIFRIVRNRCTDHLRAPARRRVGLECESIELLERDTPDTHFERGQLRLAVEQALARLPEAQREAFLLKHVDNLSYVEMAELLEASVSALKMRVMRAREALQEGLREAGFASSYTM